MSDIEFDAAFHALTGHSPMRWQRRLFVEMLGGEPPGALDIPTGLGKTSVMAIWLIALAAQAARGVPMLPRRLVYVVDRRTIVDQATDVAERMRKALRADSRAAQLHAILSSLCVDPADNASPLAISTLRGEFADNREWQADPGRAAIIVGTVDMIGSRLLFSGYGAGRSSRRAMSAGLLGHDALLVHDEAHLSEPFGRLVKEIARIQRTSDIRTSPDMLRTLRVTEMSATRHTADEPLEEARLFALNEEEKRDSVVAHRLDARKALRLEKVVDPDVARKRIVETALRYGEEETTARVLVFCYKVDDAKRVFNAIVEAAGTDRVALLIGPLRGHERDKLVSRNAVFQVFRAAADRPALPQSFYLVATSAGEVGIDLDADHMVCDLTTLDSMIQRLGRVNRLGREDREFIACIDVFDCPSSKDEEDEWIVARENTSKALSRLRRQDGARDASPRALRTLVDELEQAKSLIPAFAPKPLSPPLTDVLLDSWALNSVDELPGRPRVEDWLRGQEGEPPETVIAWREEADEIATALAGEQLSERDAYEWFLGHAIEPQERMRETTVRAVKALEAIARKAEQSGQPVAGILLDRERRRAVAIAINKLAEHDTVANATIVLPVRAGGLTRSGALDGVALHSSDVADIREAAPANDDAQVIEGRRWRARLRQEDGAWSTSKVCDVDPRLIPGLEQFNRERFERLSIDQAITKLRECVRAETGLAFAEEARLLILPGGEPDAIFRTLVSLMPAGSAKAVLDLSEAAHSEQELVSHLAAAEHQAGLIVRRLALDPDIARAVRIAARLHDRGKDRRPWQRAIGNARYPHVVLAKSGHRRFNPDLCQNYRHEFGSLIEARRNEEIRSMADWQRELVFHLIAAHHGWARPHFNRHLDDPIADGDEIAAALADTPRFHARMQRRYGRWGLAWLEALLKAADVMATKSISADDANTIAADALAVEEEPA